MRKLSHKQSLMVIIAIALLAVILQFVLGQAWLAQILVSLVGAVMAMTMFIEMIGTLKSGKYGVDLLAILAVVSSLLFSEYWAAMVILVMLTGGDALEDYASKKANTELKALLDNSPQVAHRLHGEKLEDIAVNQVQVDDKLVIKPGELVPVDGFIVEGSSNFDESSLTGESQPVNKDFNDELMSGSVNGDAVVTMQASQVAANSKYQQLIKLVKKAEATPARFVRMADRYAVPFTIVAIAIAVVAAVISKSPSRIAQVLVVASPCPLILAAPVAMVSGMSRASRNGIVVKTGDVLEKLSTAKTVAFDKTGTLTNGHLMVAEILPHQEVSQTELLQIAASVETISSHVLARSLVTYAIDKGLEMLSVSDAQEITANGVQALIQGKLVKVGKRKFVTGDPLIPSQTHTAIYVSRDDQYLGCITFTDYLRPEASQTMVQLHHLGVKKLMMLSGDQVKTAQKIGQEVGIDDVQAELLPEDKIAALKALTPEEKPVVMVGDGVNDAPSLVTADVGIAMGAHGSSAASESADLVILKDDLAKVAKAVVIAKDTIRVARQAVLIGIFICTALMLIAAFGIIPAFIGAMFQEVIDTVSILWALRARYSNEK
ncbi:heavy metal translocating P-type ATPase [Pediococcus pentosaceus]|jgi:heavy metal translocating P-type ATPase|uniref:heavy metal translocating P-type ATPase n=1 Tax=Pediococcus pentosaceus TaxID=1255 RepID=UPI000C07BE75|nr:heavy metal translocating P-type ATPase [Pediococcus pentosaceus]AVL02331.1 cadmium-translocating P-type ATPase [Pediococcus pentosaceus]MBF7134131.1 cadmium-translocating P-type ATPase [Pediococcus pentosaceus]MCQ9195499.1 cadmium-translocating P-type ATPase [Pediococcus pentosaceus]QGZ69380.1 cadmium-translocating P-type ATPase [Pediococcus pentosaceus]QPT36457.1 cadmium-translocating P-type ATPase [Pediococcus pentosaceus]